jgi:quinol monooxygenase YgiN
MASETVRVIASVTALPDKLEELKSILLGLVEPTRKEDGCLSYHLYQNKTEASDFVFVEEWTSDSAIESHMATPHVQDALSRCRLLFAREPDISRYSIIG